MSSAFVMRNDTVEDEEVDIYLKFAWKSVKQNKIICLFTVYYTFIICYLQMNINLVLLKAKIKIISLG